MSRKKETNKLAIFEGNEIRRILVDDEWYYSVVDVVRALTDSDNPRSYWSKLKEREFENDIQLSTFCLQLKLESKDGKKYLTDCADNEGLFRIIQSIPSKKAEPFKRWLARLGKERIDEIEQPAKAIERAKGYYMAKGYSPQWIETRTASIETRHSLTDAFKDSGIKEPYEYAILTNDMYKSWSSHTASEYKDYKGLSSKDSLRDNMTPLELAVTIFNEEATKEILTQKNIKGFVETRKSIHIAGTITKEAMQQLEKITGKKVVTHKNYKELNSSEIQKELAQDSLSTKELSDFNKKLKRSINVPHSIKRKRTK